MAGETINVLLVEDNPTDAFLLRESFTDIASINIQLIHIEQVQDISAKTSEQRIDIILLDLGLPDSQGLDTLFRAQAQAPRTPIVVITGLDDENLGLQALNNGAQDYLVKGQRDISVWVRSIRYAIERHRLMAEREIQMRMLESSELRFRNMIEKSVDGIAIVNKVGHILYVNPSAEALFERKNEDLVGENFPFAISVSESREFKIPQRNGDSVIAESRVVEITWESEFAYLVAMRDITERKWAEEMLEKNERLYRQAIEVANAVPYYLNYLTDQYDYMGEGIETLSGYTSEEFTPQLFNKMVSKVVLLGNLQGLTDEEAVARARSDPDAYWHADIVVVTKSGEKKWISNAAVQVQNEAGEIVGSLGILQDISERKQAEQQLSEMNRILEQRVQERTESLVRYQEQLQRMASKLTLTEQNERRRLATELHDYLAQNLVVCKMKTAQIMRQVEDLPVNAIVKQLENIVDQSLKYTRTLIAELSPTILYELGLAAALQWLAEQMKQHGLNVRLKSERENYPLADDHAIMLYQSIRELLFNVLKHAGVDESVVSLNCTEENELAVAVSDYGAGFDMQTAESDHTTLKHFGLFSIRERLEAMGGRLEIKSAINQGTTVTLIAPLATEEKIEHTVSVSHPDDAAQEIENTGQENGRVLRVMLTDDHDLVREGIRSILETEPYVRIVGEASNGEEAIEMARRLQPDVIVMDVNMPKMNGIEATRIIKRENPNIIIIALSVNDDQGITTSMKEVGATTYLTKGGPAEDLFRVIRSVYPINYANSDS